MVVSVYFYYLLSRLAGGNTNVNQWAARVATCLNGVTLLHTIQLIFFCWEWQKLLICFSAREPVTVAKGMEQRALMEWFIFGRLEDFKGDNVEERNVPLIDLTDH